jgi:hypothetical protein
MRKIIRIGMYAVLSVILVGELLALSASAGVSGLERIYADPDGTWYINAKTMVNPAGERISFWSTVVPDKSSNYYSRLGDVLAKAGKNPRRLEYVQTLLDVDCATGTISASNILFYDKRDRIMHAINVPRSEQQNPSSSLAADMLLATVCGSQVARVMEE